MQGGKNHLSFHSTFPNDGKMSKFLFMFVCQPSASAADAWALRHIIEWRIRPIRPNYHLHLAAKQAPRTGLIWTITLNAIITVHETAYTNDIDLFSFLSSHCKPHQMRSHNCNTIVQSIKKGCFKWLVPESSCVCVHMCVHAWVSVCDFIKVPWLRIFLSLSLSLFFLNKIQCKPDELPKTKKNPQIIWLVPLFRKYTASVSDRLM